VPLADAVVMGRCGPSLWVAIFVLGHIPTIDAVQMLQEASVASHRNPIAKITGMLESLEKKVRREGDEKQKVYDKYMCYCKETSASLNLQLAEVAKSLPQLRSQTQEVSALQMSLESEIAQHKKDRDEAKSAIGSAAEIRKKEADTFLKDSQSQQEAVNSLTSAIGALEQNRAASFLQTTGASVLQRLSLSADMTSRNRDLLASFLSSGSVPSGQVLGMLKQMKEDMGSDLKDMQTAEKKRLAEHLSLMEAKQKQQEVAMKAMEEKMLRLGELKVEMQVMKDDMKDQTEAQKENLEFATALNKTEEKQQAWNEYQAAQAEELQALTETVQFLSQDQVSDTLKAVSTSALVDTGVARTRRAEALSLSFLQTSEVEATGDSFELALRGQRGQGMDDVLRHIDDLHEVLDKEQASDEERQTYCETKLRRAANAKSTKQREVEDATSIIATFQNELDTVKGQIGSLQARMEELDQQVAKTTSARQAERAVFEKSRDTNNAAMELLEIAEKRLRRYYAASLVQRSKADTSSSSKVRSMSHSAPEADLSYQKQGGGALRVLELFHVLKADVQKQTSMLVSEDSIGQSEYENLVKNSNQKKMADNRSLGSKQAAKAELEADLQRSREGLRSSNQVLTALEEEVRNLHQQCDFLLKNFDLREDARRAEKRSLTRAQAVLQAAS